MYLSLSYRENTDRTPRERRENAPTPPKPKKCVLLRFAPPTGLVLRGPRKSVLFGVHIAAIPASKSPPFFVCYSELFGYPVYVLPLGVHAELQPIGRSTAQRFILLPLTCHAFASGLASIPSSSHSLKIQRYRIGNARYEERWQLITEYCVLACEPID